MSTGTEAPPSPQPDKGPVDAAIQKWQDRLGLSEWRLYVASEWNPTTDREDAYVYRMAAEREAVVAVHPSAPIWYIERLVLHELLHLVHADLDDIAENNRSIEIMELYQAQLERVINALSTALCGESYHPIDPDWRKRFELEPLPLPDPA